MGLQDYKEIVGTCAAVTTMVHMLSGTLICRDIYLKGSSKGFDPIPFLGGIGMSVLNLQYAWILADSAMINVNIFGLLTNAAYMSVYYYHSPQTKETRTLIGKVAAFVIVFLAYAQVEDPNQVEFRFGIITTVLFLMLVASPLIHLGEIIRTKNTDILPFPLIFMGTLVSFQWLLYGFVISNLFLIFQNGVGFVLCTAQLSLFVIFPSKSSNAKATTLTKED